ncbi:MAG TPA: ImmA/IrrE family metallo-endopeptidase [Tepidisphaeraceae bacterium]|jgi:hypothetical protein|nr:ImmA/IrrE family metallo-endopeptidase [Tepidisphaeraceae bacterium]
MPIHIPKLTFQQIADAAAACSKKHSDGSIPVPIEDIVDVGYRLDLVEEPDLEARFSTLAFITRDLKEIRVDKTVYTRQPYRMRFSLAHELGHLVLHEAVYKQLPFRNSREWKQSMNDLGKADYDELEWQADTFGRLLLVPPNEIQAGFGAAAKALASAGSSFKQLSRSSQDYTVKALAKSFEVSTGTIWYRLRDENLI